MKPADLHPNEPQRLATLLQYEILDSESERAFDELTELASTLCGTPISLISLVDHSRQWFKSRVGLDAAETDKSLAFCAHAILQEDIFEVPNALDDDRFADNPLVTGAPDIRFYAGVPLVAPDGSPIGTLCVIDTEPKVLDATQKRALEVLAHQVISQLEVRLHNRQLERLNQNRERLFAMLAHDLRSPFNAVIGLSKLLTAKADKLPTDQVKTLSQNILSSSAQVLQALDEVLQWSQQSLETAKPVLENLPLLPLANDCTALLKEVLAIKNLSIDIAISPGIQVNSDAVIAKSVIRNLVANAIKFSPDGSTIQLHAHIEGEKVHVSVSDQGDGVDQKVVEGLFEHNVLSVDGTRGEKGHGLGLLLCAQFLKMQGDKIWVDQSYTQGARFIFSLSLA